MNSTTKIFALLCIVVVGGIAIYGSINILSASKNNTTNPSVNAIVYKSPSCGCCGNYTPYLRKSGIDAEVKETQDMSSVKKKFAIPSEMQSCHTTVIGKYFIEGHVPIEAVEKLLKEKPNIAGIALPGMPSGSPGMPGTKNEAFNIYAQTEQGEWMPFMSL